MRKQRSLPRFHRRSLWLSQMIEWLLYANEKQTDSNYNGGQKISIYVDAKILPDISQFSLSLSFSTSIENVRKRENTKWRNFWMNNGYWRIDCNVTIAKWWLDTFMEVDICLLNDVGFVLTVWKPFVIGDIDVRKITSIYRHLNKSRNKHTSSQYVYL